MLAWTHAGAIALEPDSIVLPVTRTKTGLDSAPRLRFVGSLPGGSLEGIGTPALPTTILDLRAASVFGSAREQAFDLVARPGLYHGIDLVYYGNGGTLEFDFVVKPESDPAQIRWAAHGFESVRLIPSGDLSLIAGAAEYIQRAPIAYQTIAGVRVPVECSYFETGAGVFGFRIGAYRRDLDLVIDPILDFASYIGGWGDFSARGLYRDVSGYLHLVGEGTDNILPAETIPGEVGFDGERTYQVLKLDLANRRWLQRVLIRVPASTPNFISREIIRIGADGSIAGYFTLPSSGLETTVPPYGSEPQIQNSPLQLARIYIFRIAPQGQLTYLTRLSCDRSISANDLTVSANGEISITGDTSCTDFPLNANAYDQVAPVSGASPGSSRSFLFKLSPDGTRAVASTFYGGPTFLARTKVLLLPGGDHVLASQTSFPDAPVSPGAMSAQLRGGYDLYVAQISADGSALQMGTYLGGDGEETLEDAAVDSVGNVFLRGSTASIDFPLSPPAFEPEYTSPPATGPFRIPVLMKLKADGSGFHFAVSPRDRLDTSSTLVIDAAGRSLIPLEGGGCVPAGTAIPRGGIGHCLGRVAADGSRIEISPWMLPVAGGRFIGVAALEADRVAAFTSVGRPDISTSAAPLMPAPNSWEWPLNSWIGWLGVFDFLPPTVCIAEASPAEQRVPATGADVTVRVSTQPGCPWSMPLDAGTGLMPLTVTQGIGPGEVRVRVGANRNGPPDAVFGSNGNPSFRIVQDAASCEESRLSAAALQFPTAGGSQTIAVDRASKCRWVASSKDPWIAISPLPGEYGGAFDSGLTLTVTVGANSFARRSGSIEIAGIVVPVDQDSGSCTAILTPDSQNLGPGAATISVNVQAAGAGCTWQAFPGPGVAVQGASSGTGSATLALNVAANPYPGPNETFLYVAGRTIVLRQAAGLCVASAPSAAPAQSRETRATVTYEASGPACGWRPVSEASWIRPLIDGMPSNGAGTLTLEIDANPGDKVREGWIDNLGLRSRVLQAGRQEWLLWLTDNAGGVDIALNGRQARTPLIVTGPPDSRVPVDIPYALLPSPGSFLILPLDFGGDDPMGLWVHSEVTAYSINYELYHGLTLASGAGGRVQTSFGGTAELPLVQRFRDGTELTLKAEASPGFTFVRWEGDVTGSSPDISIRMDSPKSLVARFVPAAIPPEGFAEFIPSTFRVLGDYVTPLGDVPLLLESTPPGEVWEPTGVECESYGAGHAVYRFSSTAAQVTPYRFTLTPTTPAGVQLRPGEYLCTAHAHRVGAASRMVGARFAVQMESDPRRAALGQMNATTNGATFSRGPLAPGGIFTVFGVNLAGSTVTADALPLPTMLSGARIVARSHIDDSVRDCPLFYVSPAQVNALLPEDLPEGTFTLELLRNGELRSIDPKLAVSSAPGIFRAPGGVVAAVTAVLARGETQRGVSLVECGLPPGALSGPVCSAIPPQLWTDAEDLYVSLYATGLGEIPVGQLAAYAGDTPLSVTYVGPQGYFAGLDQINVLVPRSLRGAGLVTIEVRYAFDRSEFVTLAF